MNLTRGMSVTVFVAIGLLAGAVAAEQPALPQPASVPARPASATPGALFAPSEADSTQLPPEMAPDFTLPVIAPRDTFQLSEHGSQPVLLFFFDAGDMASTYAVPYVSEWYRRYLNDGLVIIGIQEPEYPPMMDVRTVLEATARADAFFPVAMDSTRSVSAAYAVQGLPAFVVIRPGGKIALETWEARPYAEVETGIQRVLAEIKPDIVNPFLVKPLRPTDDPTKRVLAATPVVMLGCESGTISAFHESECDSFCNYKDLGEKIRGLAYLQGYWKVTPNSAAHEIKFASADDHLRLIYSGKGVWLLPGFVSGSPQRIYVKQDHVYIDKAVWGQDIYGDEVGNPYILMKYPVPVHVINNRSFGTHELELMPVEGDAAFYYIFFEDGVAE